MPSSKGMSHNLWPPSWNTDDSALALCMHEAPASTFLQHSATNPPPRDKQPFALTDASHFQFTLHARFWIVGGSRRSRADTWRTQTWNQTCYLLAVFFESLETELDVYSEGVISLYRPLVGSGTAGNRGSIILHCIGYNVMTFQSVCPCFL